MKDVAFSEYIRQRGHVVNHIPEGIQIHASSDGACKRCSSNHSSLRRLTLLQAAITKYLTTLNRTAESLLTEQRVPGKGVGQNIVLHIADHHRVAFQLYNHFFSKVDEVMFKDLLLCLTG